MPPRTTQTDIDSLHERLVIVEQEQHDQSSAVEAQRLQLEQLYRIYEQIKGIKWFVVTLAGIAGSLLTIGLTFLSVWGWN